MNKIHLKCECCEEWHTHVSKEEYLKEREILCPFCGIEIRPKNPLSKDPLRRGFLPVRLLIGGYKK